MPSVFKFRALSLTSHLADHMVRTLFQSMWKSDNLEDSDMQWWLSHGY